MNGESTRFQPGNTAAKGRAVAQMSVRVREAIGHFIEMNFSKVQEDFDKVKPAQRLMFIADLMPYIAPKLQAIHMEGNIENKHIITLDLGDRLQVHSANGNGISEGHNGLIGPIHDNGSGNENGQDG